MGNMIIEYVEYEDVRVTSTCCDKEEWFCHTGYKYCPMCGEKIENYFSQHEWEMRKWAERVRREGWSMSWFYNAEIGPNDDYNEDGNRLWLGYDEVNVLRMWDEAITEDYEREKKSESWLEELSELPSHMSGRLIVTNSGGLWPRVKGWGRVYDDHTYWKTKSWKCHRKHQWVGEKRKKKPSVRKWVHKGDQMSC